jgi:mannose PTS system EIID component
MRAFQLTLRLFLIQVLWNYRTLLGAGLAWAILPFLRRAGSDDPARLEGDLREAARTFNAHPYLCGFAAGALVRMREEGSPPEERARFREAIRGPLGSLGDSLFWAAWLPTCVLVFGVGGLMGFPPLAAVVGFLLLYNTLHLLMRYKGALAGLELGRSVGNALGAIQISRWRERVGAGGVLSVGALLGYLVTRGVRPGSSFEIAALAGAGSLALALFAGGLLATRVRWWVAAALTPGAALALLLVGAMR